MVSMRAQATMDITTCSRPKRPPQLLEHVAQHLRLDREDHDLAGLRRQQVVPGDLDAAQLVQFLLPVSCAGRWP